MSSKKTSIPDLSAFARAKRREGCKVCALEGAIREQLREASSKKITRAIQLEWLATVVGVKLSSDDLSTHVNGRHEDALA